MYNILEVANTHSGNKDYLLKLIEEFKEFKGGFGIKFQPFHPDLIAVPDYEWYPVYEKLVFNENDWNEIILAGNKTKDIWLDLFDVYGIKVLENNFELVFGLKLQASVLYNYEVINGLKDLKLDSKKLIINVSGLSLEEIDERVLYFERILKPEELWIEIGFQAYPTKLEDSGVSKISILKSKFKNKLVFADHVDGNSKDAITLPVIAHVLGADVIEKHIMHSKLPAEYDHFSSLNINQYKEYIEMVSSYSPLKDESFMNDREIAYLDKSIQMPLAARDLVSGSIIYVNRDLTFKRSNEKGLNVLEIESLISNRYVLSSNKKAFQTFQKEDFKKATIATIVAGRLKSSRLTKKGILKIGQLSSTERCIKSCLRFNETNYTILATSTELEDDELKHHTFSNNVFFHKGDPDDVIRRYLDIINDLKIDIVFRVTADMPYVSSEVADFLLKKHFEEGADYTAATNGAVGICPEVINAEALREVKKHFPNADYSEYMSWYFQNNKDYFKVNLVELPEEFHKDYRLTIDYQEDLEMLNEIENHFEKNKLPSDIVNVYNFLDSKPEVSKINQHIKLKYKTDQKLIEILNRETRINKIK